ncbi:MAG TPA: hypothetical protein VJ647_00405 [Chitinophagaceae bacterium]|nr:hypothetical protein [Chitinophagaceae bacterium]
MKKLCLFSLLLVAVSFSSCEVIGGIFKAGVWTGIIVVALVIFLIIWLLTRSGGNK